jgi:hypothetical protein
MDNEFNRICCCCRCCHRLLWTYHNFLTTHYRKHTPYEVLYFYLKKIILCKKLHFFNEILNYVRCDHEECLSYSYCPAYSAGCSFSAYMTYFLLWRWRQAVPPKSRQRVPEYTAPHIQKLVIFSYVCLSAVQYLYFFIWIYSYKKEVSLPHPVFVSSFQHCLTYVHYANTNVVCGRFT